MGPWFSKPAVLNEDTKDVATAAASELAKQMTEKALKATTGAVTVAVGGAVGGALAKVIVVGLWGQILPSESALTSDEIRSVVKQELQKETLIEIKAVLHDLSDMLSKDYAQNKRHKDLTDHEDRKDLHDFLERLNERLIGVIGRLMDENYAKIGLSTFILLAGFRLALYQEMANVDPDNEDPYLNPAMSARYATPGTGLVAQYAKEYAEHVEKWWQQVLEDRRKLIVVGTSTDRSGISIRERISDSAIRRPLIQTRAYTVFEGSPSPPIQTLLEEYQQQAAVKLAEKFNHPDQITANWRKLIDQPINMAVEDDG